MIGTPSTSTTATIAVSSWRQDGGAVAAAAS